jgi:hypothetical protein
VFYITDLAKNNWSVAMPGKKDCGDWECSWGGGIQPIWRNFILWHFIQAPTLGN